MDAHSADALRPRSRAALLGSLRRDIEYDFATGTAQLEAIARTKPFRK